jgi:hypothetical protein
MEPCSPLPLLHCTPNAHAPPRPGSAAAPSHSLRRSVTWIPCRQSLIERKSHDLGSAIPSRGRAAGRFRGKSRLQLHIYDKSGNTDWVFSLGDGSPKLETSTVDHPRLEILTQKETML